MRDERLRELAWVAASVAATVILALLIVPNGADLEVWAFILAPVALWLLVRRRLNRAYLSPVTVVAGVFWGIATFGYLLRDQLAQATSGASIRIVLDEPTALDTLRLMSGAVMLVLAGAWVALMRSAKVVSTPDLLAGTNKPPKVGLILLAATVPMLLIIIDVGIPDLLQRDYYILGERGSLMGSLGAPLATAAVLVSGYAWGATKGVGRFASGALVLCYAALLLSYGSRRFAMIPILVALGVFVALQNKRAAWGIALAAGLTLLLLPLPLEFRNSPAHGFIPYLDAFSNFSFEDVDWLGTLNNILVAFPIIGATAFGTTQVFPSDILISLNPIPGTDAGWYEIYPRLRLNLFTPTAGIGELGKVGWQAVTLFFVALGMFLAWVEVVVRRQIERGWLPYVGILIALVALFALQIVQYNLRSAVRLLVYLAVIELARQALSAIRGRRPTVGVERRPIKATRW